MKYLVAIAALACACAAQAAPVTPLAKADVTALLLPPAKGAKVIAIWALDCAYCEENLSALLAWQRSHENVDLVFVATDAIGQATALEARLKAAKLDGVPSRAYADPSPERLNFLIDPTWGGETPRTLVIRADGSKNALSGALTAERIARLMP
ncbi:thioredoxin domain-containing protein [Luteibacter sahnii]|uniref:hypothetical protein n=1 Tax=Luteibacter sahnii TaxID=3021977 RepID=UPI002A6AF75A|nr:hypothetical protein [Luteibacter sp. PPL193]MDY1547204.1 hypothetical protein [Luteibacter sp. PPL193]